MWDLYQQHYYHDLNQGPSWNSHYFFCLFSLQHFSYLSWCFLGLEVNRLWMLPVCCTEETALLSRALTVTCQWLQCFELSNALIKPSSVAYPLALRVVFWTCAFIKSYFFTSVKLFIEILYSWHRCLSILSEQAALGCTCFNLCNLCKEHLRINYYMYLAVCWCTHVPTSVNL